MDKGILYRYFSHTATEDERAAVRQWVESSPENLKLFMQARSMFDATVLLADNEFPSARLTGLRVRRIAIRLSKIAAVAAE